MAHIDPLLERNKHFATTACAEKLYNRSASSPAQARSRAEILRLFEGVRLVDPGLVYVPLWCPGSPGDVPADPSRFANLVGVGRTG